MRIAVFGATGGIGKNVVRFALNQNYYVNAYVRNPKKMDIHDEKLTVYEGMVSDYCAMKEAMKRCDAVVIALGISMKFGYRDTASIEAHENIIRIMQELGIRRLIDWSTPSVKDEKDTKSFITIIPGIMAGLFLPKAKKVLLEVSGQVKHSNLDWTIVRFMAPKDTAYTGNVKVSFGEKKLKFAISRADIGAFMVQQIESDEYLYRMPIIGT